MYAQHASYSISVIASPLVVYRPIDYKNTINEQVARERAAMFVFRHHWRRRLTADIALTADTRRTRRGTRCSTDFGVVPDKVFTALYTACVIIVFQVTFKVTTFLTPVLGSRYVLARRQRNYLPVLIFVKIINFSSTVAIVFYWCGITILKTDLDSARSLLEIDFSTFFFTFYLLCVITMESFGHFEIS